MFGAAARRWAPVATRPGTAGCEEVLALREEGVGATEIAKRLGIGRASVYRIIEDARAAA